MMVYQGDLDIACNSLGITAFTEALNQEVRLKHESSMCEMRKFKTGLRLYMNIIQGLDVFFKVSVSKELLNVVLYKISYSLKHCVCLCDCHSEWWLI